MLRDSFPVTSFPLAISSNKNGATGSSQFWPGRGWPRFQTDGWLGGWVVGFGWLVVVVVVVAVVVVVVVFLHISC